MNKKIIVKKAALFLSIVLALAVTGFVIDPGTSGSNDLTKNAKLKNEVFSQITNNRELFTEFMNDMMQNPQSMQWMMGNEGMMDYMFSGNHLGYMMHSNPGMNQMMMQSMMNTIRSDSTWSNQWNQMMYNHNGMNGMRHGGMMYNQ